MNSGARQNCAPACPATYLGSQQTPIDALHACLLSKCLKPVDPETRSAPHWDLQRPTGSRAPPFALSHALHRPHAATTEAWEGPRAAARQLRMRWRTAGRNATRAAKTAKGQAGQKRPTSRAD